MTDFNLFALTTNPARRVLRIPLSKDVQQEVNQLFHQQEASFRDSYQEEIAFDGKYTPESGECLVIHDYTDIDKLQSALKSPLGLPQINPTEVEFATIKSLFSGFEKDDGTIAVLFQYFDKRKIISSAGISLFHASNVYRKVDGVGITLDSDLAAILEGSSLKFFSFWKARQIFDLTDHYIEATNADIETFAAMPEISVKSVPALLGISDTWVRRKLAILKQSQILQNLPAENIVQAAGAFDIVVATTEIDGKKVIVLPDTKPELKTLLRFLDEDYYLSALLGDQYLSNSKRRIK